MAKFIVTGDQHFDITGQMLEIQRQIRQRGGSPIDPKLVTQNLQNIIEGKMKKDCKFLRLYSEFGSLTIAKCKGKRTFLNTTHVFKAIDWGGIDQAELEDVSNETDPVPVQIFEYDGLGYSYSQLFSYFYSGFEKVCFSQDQILMFWESYDFRHRSSKEDMDIFLLRCKNRMYIVQVCEGFDGLYAWVKRFSFEQLPTNYRVRLVVPKKLK